MTEMVKKYNEWPKEARNEAIMYHLCGSTDHLYTICNITGLDFFEVLDIITAKELVG